MGRVAGACPVPTVSHGHRRPRGRSRSSVCSLLLPCLLVTLTRVTSFVPSQLKQVPFVSVPHFHGMTVPVARSVAVG